VSMIAIVLRHAFALENLVTTRHLDLLGKLLLATGLMTAYGYFAEIYAAYYGGELYETQTMWDRFIGAYAFSYWGAVICNFVPLQLLWWRAMRSNPIVLFLVSLSVAVGMWFERY